MERARFADWSDSDLEALEGAMFLDEQPWTYHSWRRKGRSQTGRRAVLGVATAAGPTHTLALALCPQTGVKHSDFWVGGTTGATLAIFMEAALIKMGVPRKVETEPASVHARFLLLDNASPHHREVSSEAVSHRISHLLDE